MTSLLTTMRQRLADAEADAARLREAIEILEQAESPPSAVRADGLRAARASASAPAASTPAPRKRKPAVKKTTAKTVVPLEKLLKFVSEHPGMTTTAVASGTGGDQSVLLELLKESEQKGEVRREGERRATAWYRITDEDRIAARAAEIAAQSKAPGAKRSSNTSKRKVGAAA